MTDKKPWLGKSGEKLSDQELVQQTRDWDLETWNAMLREEEVPLREKLLAGDEEVDHHSVGYNDMVDEPTYRENLDGVVTFVRGLLGCLTKRERSVIYALYWEKLTEREIAARLRIGRSSVRNHRDRALKKMMSEGISKMRLIKALRASS